MHIYDKILGDYNAPWIAHGKGKKCPRIIIPEKFYTVDADILKQQEPELYAEWIAYEGGEPGEYTKPRRTVVIHDEQRDSRGQREYWISAGAEVISY